MSDTLKRIDKARWWLLTKQTFYGSLAMSLADVIDPSISTACTNGKVIKWNPEFVATLDDPELRFVLLHETLHCAHLHMWRLPHDATGNEAADYAINLTLQGIDGISMPEGGLLDKKWAGMSEEEIYAKLTQKKSKKPDDGGKGKGGSKGGQPQDQPSGGSGDDQGDQGDQPQDGGDDADSGSGQPTDGGKSDKSGGKGGKPNPCGDFEAPAADDTADAGDQAAEQEELREQWEERVFQAAQAAQASGRGDIPADMERELDRLRAQEVDWRRELADFVKSTVSTRNDWSRAARRHAWQRVIYPRRMTDAVGTVLFARDTSGSIDLKACAEFTALINACIEEMGCEGIVVDCNTAIQAEHRINDYEKCPDLVKWGGGTRFQPVFDRAAELIAGGEEIAGIVYLTDLDADAPTEPDIPTLWMATSDRQPPFGRSVRIKGGR